MSFLSFLSDFLFMFWSFSKENSYVSLSSVRFFDQAIFSTKLKSSTSLISITLHSSYELFPDESSLSLFKVKRAIFSQKKF